MSTPKSNFFSDRLKSLRGDRSKADFARFLGMAAAVYQRYEAGRTPSANNLKVISDKCKVSIDWLLIQETPPPAMVEEDQAEYLIDSKNKQITMHKQVMNEIEKRIEMIEYHGGELQEQLVDQIVARVKEYAVWCSANLENARAVAAEAERLRQEGKNGKQDGAK